MATVYGFDPCCIILPLTKNQFLRVLQNSIDFQISFADHYGRLGNLYLPVRLWNFFIPTKFVLTKIAQSFPFHKKILILLMAHLMVQKGVIVQIVINLLILFFSAQQVVELAVLIHFIPLNIVLGFPLL